MAQSGVVSSDLIQLNIEAIDLGAPAIEPGATVEVRRRFDHAWARGFEVLEFTDGGYRLRRDPADVKPWAETCGQIRCLVEEKDGRARVLAAAAFPA